jgi:hypothetical protein
MPSLAGWSCRNFAQHELGTKVRFPFRNSGLEGPNFVGKPDLMSSSEAQLLGRDGAESSMGKWPLFARRTGEAR